MKTLALGILFCAGPAAAWDFTPLPICTLTQPTERGNVTVTYDPVRREYAIRLALSDSVWDSTETFTMAFLGGRPLQIGTDRHQLSDDGTTLTVTDTGFGNVLDGLQFNTVAEARAGITAMVISLSDAAEPVAAFRACGVAAMS